MGLLLHRTYHGDWFEFAGFVSGVVYVYLSAVEHIINWPVGIVNVVIYAWVCFTARLFADMSLQIVYVALSIHGWYSWARGGTNQSELPITRIQPRSWLVVLLVWAAGTVAFVPIDRDLLHGASPWLDSILAVGSLVAQVMNNVKKFENWILWIGINAAYLPLYYSRQLQATSVLYGLYFALSLYGLINWNRLLRGQNRLIPQP